MAVVRSCDTRLDHPLGGGMSRRQDILGLFMGTYFLGIGVGFALLALDSEILRAFVGLGGLVGCFATAQAAAKRSG